MAKEGKGSEDGEGVRYEAGEGGECVFEDESMDLREGLGFVKISREVSACFSRIPAGKVDGDCTAY